MSIKDAIKEKIETLPDSLLLEVFDFIQFIETKKERILLAKASQELSRPSFNKIWNNDEDAIYDNL
ncbi:MAG: toxin-antitoxin system, antitoxin component, Xre family protein [Thermodesulfovibrionales bacterium]